MRILNVAEKPDAAKKIATILSNGRMDRKPGFSKYNPIYEFKFRLNNRDVIMVVTSVTGHLMDIDFSDEYKSWHSCDPSVLFDLSTTIVKSVPKKSEPIEKSLLKESKSCSKLVLWLDCDREGENIGFEVVHCCRKSNSRLSIHNGSILRARFSELTPSAINRAVQNLQKPNELESLAVEARREIDLRIGSAFTRFQTLRLRSKFQGLPQKVISYGPCQFPTLGFVVERFWRIKCFIPETFWNIKCTIQKEDATAEFQWSRGRLYDQLTCLILYEMCLDNISNGIISDVYKNRKLKYKPFPLNTVELQKLAARKLRFGAQQTMNIAEKLYNKGLISYPRTETDQYNLSDNDLKSLLQQQTQNNGWGDYTAEMLQQNTYNRPRRGRNDDKAHPPIHPIKALSGSDNLTSEESKLYELVCRHFVGCCSPDAVGYETKVTFGVSGEKFVCKGLAIEQYNYLKVYTYDKWTDKNIPNFTLGEKIIPKSFLMNEGKTQSPPLLTESDLITLMDRNGIGTDATIAQHIQTIQDRGYAVKRGNQFVPTDLGVALVKGYDSIGYDLSKPNLRAKMEEDMKDILTGKKTKSEVLVDNLTMYKVVFADVFKNATKLDDSVGKFFDSLGSTESGQQYVVLKKSLSTCGKCNGKADLKKQSDNRFLCCSTCNDSLLLPHSGKIKPFDHTCPYCSYQVLELTNTQTKKSHTLCPHCFMKPPDVEEAHMNGFRCFSCSHPTCTLASSSKKGMVYQCPVCNQNSLALKKTKTSKFVLSCKGYPSCTNSTWLPSATEDAKVSKDVCQQCLRGNDLEVHLIDFTFKAGSMPPPMTSQYSCCVVCDPNIKQFLSVSNTRPSSSSNNSRGRTQQNTLDNAFLRTQSPSRTNPTTTNSRTTYNNTNNTNAYQNNSGINNRIGNTGFQRASAISMENNFNERNSSPNTGTFCNCGNPAALRTVRKESENKGRQFFSCESKGCNFFQWVDQER